MELCVETFKPFWGCVSNGQNAREYGQYLVDGKPSTVHWINYWSDSICKQIGMKKIKKVCEQNNQISFQDHFFRIKETPLDTTCEDDLRLQKTINSCLRLGKHKII